MIPGLDPCAPAIVAAGAGEIGRVFVTRAPRRREVFERFEDGAQPRRRRLAGIAVGIGGRWQAGIGKRLVERRAHRDPACRIPVDLSPDDGTGRGSDDAVPIELLLHAGIDLATEQADPIRTNACDRAVATRVVWRIRIVARIAAGLAERIDRRRDPAADAYRRRLDPTVAIALWRPARRCLESVIGGRGGVKRQADEHSTEGLLDRDRSFQPVADLWRGDRGKNIIVDDEIRADRQTRAIVFELALDGEVVCRRPDLLDASARRYCIGASDARVDACVNRAEQRRLRSPDLAHRDDFGRHS